MPASILLVEDDPLFRETVRETLISAGYHVLEAGDGLQALDCVRERHPDLVLLDFDLPRMMGDEALERMLEIRPGLICFVLSGKDDLHQALLMGRRGAYGWIDKYVGTDRLVALVGQGLKTRPRDLDLVRLVATGYPQPVAVPFLAWKRGAPDLPTVDRLIALRELFEAIVEYLGITALAVYLNRGLLDDDINARFLNVLQQPSPGAWLAAVESLCPHFEAQPRAGWWHELARVLQRPMARGDLVGEVVRAVGQQAALPPESGSQTLVHLLAALAAYHDLWMTPRLLPPEDARSLADLFELALEQAVGELSLLADVELCWVEQITVTSEGDYAIHFDALSGQTMQNRHVRLPGPLRQGELYLVSRATREPLAPLGPMMVYSRCEAAGPVAHGVFSIAQLVPNRRAMYLSRACGHLRWVDSPATLESIRHLFFQLNPRGDDHGHLLRQVAVGLFDLSGYTPLTRQRGPTAAREFVRRMVAVVRESVESRGGTMGAPVGDEVLVYFDAPQAALLAAVDAMRTLQQLNSRNPQGAIHVHVGLDFGMGIVERNDVWGDVINRAKRCQSIARPDEVVISAEMASAVGSTTEIRLERIAGELKGFGQAEVFKVHWQPRESP